MAFWPRLKVEGCSRIPDSRFPIPDSQFPIPDSRISGTFTT
ncbi:hypothetical protein [Moorena sp. SIO4G3]|nr:hypothetical protein [Moorena sp. SIO4G3]